MFVTQNLRKVKGDFVRRLFEVRTVSLVKRQYSQNVDEFLKFYSDDNIYEDKYKPLNESDYDRFISVRSAQRVPALTRHMASLAYKVGKDMLSLAEGMPNEQMFPFSRLSLETTVGDTMVLEAAQMGTAFQYVPSRGLPSLLSEIHNFQAQVHRPPEVPREVLVTNGGQHGIYQCVELLMNPGDPVLIHEYAYTGVHVALKPYQPEIIGIPEDEHGIVPETIDSILGERLRRGFKMPKMMYVIPTGSNPTGTVIPEGRRRLIYELACKYDFLIVEDDPYMFLNYKEHNVPSFLSMDTCGRVLRLDSISKVVSAGLRGAWITAPAPLIQRMELHSQAELLHPCTLGQFILQHLLTNRSSLAAHLKTTRDFYRHRRDALYKALQPINHLASYTFPDAGLFFWLKVHGVDDVFKMVFQTALERGLMVIPGHAFLYDNNAQSQHIRLTFSKIRLEDMDTAVSYLAEIIADEQQRTLLKPKRFADNDG